MHDVVFIVVCIRCCIYGVCVHVGVEKMLYMCCRTYIVVYMFLYISCCLDVVVEMLLYMCCVDVVVL